MTSETQFETREKLMHLRHKEAKQFLEKALGMVGSYYRNEIDYFAELTAISMALHERDAALKERDELLRPLV